MIFSSKQSGIVNKSSSGNLKPDDVAKSALDIWNEQVGRVHARFSRYIGHREDLTSFIEAVCTKFIENQDVDEVLQHTVALGEFQKSLYRSQAGILELDGIGESWSQANKVVRKVSKTLAWVEDIYCSATLGIKDFRQEFKTCGFMYQKE
jgi:hypothetical protein